MPSVKRSFTLLFSIIGLFSRSSSGYENIPFNTLANNTVHPFVFAPTPLAPTATSNINPTVTSPASTTTTNLDDTDCSIFIGSTIYLYYWQTGTPSTACLAGLPSATAYEPAMPSMVSPSIYVIFTEISAGNAHTQYGKSYTSVTLSFAPGELSTVEGSAGATKYFNFEDLPCPPPDVAAADLFFYNPASNPTRRYEPRVLPPTKIRDLDPDFSTCTFAPIYQGFDPASAVMPAVKGPLPPGFQRPGGHRKPKRYMRRQDPMLNGQSRATPNALDSNANPGPYNRHYRRPAIPTPPIITQPPVMTAPPPNK